MRKYFLSIVALVGMLFATSCQESLVEPQIDGTTTFTVQVPNQMGTKAIGEASSVTQLLVDVYPFGVEEPIYQTLGTPTSEGFEVELNLIQDQKYDILFWAQTEDGYVDVTETDGKYLFGSLRNVPMNSNYLNNDNGAAFFHAEKGFVPSGTSTTITLVRPFAQLNLGTTDLSLKPATGDVKLHKSLITVKGVATNFNVYEGLGYGNKDVVYVYGPEVQGQTEKQPVAVPEDSEKLTIGVDPNAQTYNYVSMNYLAVLGDTKAVVDVDAKIIVKDLANNGEERTIEHSFKSVPVQENYRTNIVGNLISSTTDFNVVVDDKFVDENGDNVSDDYNMLIWDGESIKVPSYDDATKTYSISNGAELAWLAATVSGDPLTRSENEPNSLADKTVKLTDDIYLGENEWKPIGMDGKHFEGIFDGQGHTIYGLKVASRSSKPQAALFCSAAGNAQFKDFTIDGAKIIYPGDGDDYYAAGVVGTIYGNLTFENITVKNSRITGNNKVAGLIAHDGSSTQITIDNCHILDSYIASEDLEDGGCVGGMIGYYATGQAGKENNISNSSVEDCTIIGVNSSNSGKRANSEFIGSIKTKADMVLNITDCILEGNTFTQTINGTDPVTYLSAFNPQYIGGDREEKTLGTITISINGETPAVRVTTSAQLQHVVNSATSDITVEFANDLGGKIILYQKEGVKVTIDGKEKTYTGGIQIFGDNSFTDYEMEIKKIKFVASGIDANAEGCIYVTDNNEQLNCNARNVTIQDCTFEGVGNVFAAIRQDQGGTSQDWTINNCEVLEGMHSFLQINNMSGLRVDGCTVNSKNGANLNQTVSASFENCKFDVKGYAVRVGVNQQDTNPISESFNFNKCELKSANSGGDAVVIIRGTAQDATLNFEDTELIGNPKISGYNVDTQIDGIEIAKVGDTEYYNSIDEAIAAWTNNTTLTLLANVTLCDVVKIKSTEHHILNLGTFTMTAASGKDAIEITCEGQSKETYALTVNADATNPGGITASGKSCIYYKKSGTMQDRPIIRINNGIFNGSYSINVYSSNRGTNCPTVWIYDGVFNCYMSIAHGKMLIYGGTFNASINCTGDSTAYRQISGGRFKSWQYMTADASNKFWVGSAKETYDVGVYVDKDGYLVVGGPVITEAPGTNYEKKSYSSWSSYLKYSSAAEYGLYYE